MKNTEVQHGHTTKQATLNLYSHLLYSYGTKVSVESSLLTCTNTRLYGETTKRKVVRSSTDLPANLPHPARSLCTFAFYFDFTEVGRGQAREIECLCPREHSGQHAQSHTGIHLSHLGFSPSPQVAICRSRIRRARATR